MSPSNPITSRIPKRSMGLKLLLVCGLALLMSIPALAVFGILHDRTNRARDVTAEISGLIGGEQTFVGPILAVPYVTPALAAPVGGQATPAIRGVHIIFPETGRATADIKTNVRKRGLFKATVWNADLKFASTFDLTTAGSQAPAGAIMDWSRAEFLVGASDARGAQSSVVLTAGGQAVDMAPAAVLDRAGMMDGGSGHRRVSPMDRSGGAVRFFGAHVANLAAPGAKFEVATTARFAGAQRIAIVPYAKTTTFHAVGDWPDPSYNGGFLPVRHGSNPVKSANGENGFTADWSVPFIARGVAGEGSIDVLSPLGAAALGVTFADTANPYQAVSRSLKYELMFVGLVFLAYFLFETVQKKRVHPAQYVLIGLAQIIFYLLLLSLAERVGFDLGFLIAAAATVSLISAYAGWVFESRKQGFVALASFIGLYGLIYVLMRLEDWALLVGAVASFAAIAAVMYFTRRLDWYGVGEGGKSESGAA